MIQLNKVNNFLLTPKLFQKLWTQPQNINLDENKFLPLRKLFRII